MRKSDSEKTTIIDVARAAGVAVATVSRVINNKDSVREETRGRVLQAMRELSYYPNQAARSLGMGAFPGKAEKTSLSIGLINDSLRSDPYFVHVLQGVERELSFRRCHCYYMQMYSEPSQEDSANYEYQLSNLVMEDKLDGIIGVSILGRKIIELFSQTRLPFVLVDSADFGDTFHYCRPDVVTGAKKAVEYLISQGHERIALINGDSSTWFFRELEDGFAQALRDGGLKYDSLTTVYGGNSVEGGYGAAGRLLDMERRPTAIFTNDITALGVIRAVKDRGLRIPDDISLMGFDDIDMAAHTEPPLSTVQIPKNDLGRVAARKVLELVGSGEDSPVMKTTLSTKLIIRGSVGSPSNG